jgi:FtsZ-binding cell division protein ZapB
MHLATMDTFEASKPDQFHQSLSSAWASFLGAQHCSREVGALGKTLDEHIQQTNLAVTSLQRDTATRHDLLAAAVADSKSKIEHHVAEIKETAALRASLSTLQQEIRQDREDASRKATELAEKVDAQQEGLTGWRSAISQDITSIQKQYRQALEEVKLLQRELRETRAEKMASDQKLAALESQVDTIAQTRQGLSEDMVGFLEDMLCRRSDLTRLLELQSLDTPAPSMVPRPAPMTIPLAHTPALPQEVVSHEKPPAQATYASQHDSSKNSQPTAAAKRKPEEPLQSQPKRPAPPSNPNQDIRSLYLVFRDRYKANPPSSDTAFIWEFISSIESQTMSKHIQKSLAAILPEHVTPSRDTRRKNPRRHVDISRGLTWRKFREALVKIPGPS